MERVDIFVVGGGLAGMAAACRLATDGHSVALAAPSAPKDPDMRTTAILQPGIETLTKSGVWKRMETQASSIDIMRLVDAGGVERWPREIADFKTNENPGRPFGMNIANGAIRTALEAQAAALNIRRLAAPVTGTLGRTEERLLRFADGAQISAKLVLAADGRNSTLRRLENLSVRRWHYGQRALVFAVHHPHPHCNVSTEIHRTGGPLTLVPMPDRNGRPTSSVVWITPGPRAVRLSKMLNAELAAELTTETMDLFGPLEITGDRAMWPVIGQIAPRLTAPRMALIAEAARVVPPIGAQGLNMSLADIECLAELIEGIADPGADTILSRYRARRRLDIAMRVAGIDALNRAAQAEAQPLRDLRRCILGAVSRTAPIRDLAIKLGLGG